MGRSILITTGLIILAAGLLISLAPKSLNWLGRMPGDIAIKRGNSGCYFPLTTSLIISAFISLIMWFFRK